MSRTLRNVNDAIAQIAFDEQVTVFGFDRADWRMAHRIRDRVVAALTAALQARENMGEEEIARAFCGIGGCPLVIIDGLPTCGFGCNTGRKDKLVAGAKRILSLHKPAGKCPSSIAHKQDQGVAWDIIAEAVQAFDEWSADDDYDAMGAINRIIGRMKKRAAYYGPIARRQPLPAAPEPKPEEGK
jgi:hypothetical protein